MTPHFVCIVLVGVSFALIFEVHRASTMECGTVNFVRPAVLGGIESMKGEWPFIVAIQNHSNYICGGTIISKRHILTAAHCIQKKKSETELSPDVLVVRLGAYNLTNNNEKGVILRNVSEIYMHDDWDPFRQNFDADIAILVLSENITFTDDIQPVCMPANGVTENMEGTVVGYAVRPTTSYAQIPRQIVVRAVNRSHCFREDDVLRSFSSNRTFCGGNGDGSPDLGDSGTGYFFTPGFSWAQYGIVAALHTNATGHIFLHAFHIYTNLTMYKDWIKETVNRTGGEVGEARTNIIMKCDYSELVDSVYSCQLNNIDIQGNNFETGSFVGSHLYEKSRQDVKEIQFVNGTMSHLPSGFGLFFENIERLIVGELSPISELLGTKVVRRSDLRTLKNLRMLSFYRNDIKSLYENALWDVPNLRTIKFIENKLTVLFNETFSNNKELMQVILHSNQLNFLPANLFRNNPMLREVDFRNNFIKAIDENFFRANRRLSLVSFNSNQLEMLPRRLFKNNFLLRGVYCENNSLSSIDENLFETNRHLVGVSFSFNRIESLPRQLFRNNLQLGLVQFDNNAIMTIDENVFMRNEKLDVVSFSHNRLERLQENLFRQNSLLVVMDFSNNRLKQIDVDFAEFRRVGLIGLHMNDCVNAGYIKEDASKCDIIFGNLVDFQNLVETNCSAQCIVSRKES